MSDAQPAQATTQVDSQLQKAFRGTWNPTVHSEGTGPRPCTQQRQHTSTLLEKALAVSLKFQRKANATTSAKAITQVESQMQQLFVAQGTLPCTQRAQGQGSALDTCNTPAYYWGVYWHLNPTQNKSHSLHSTAKPPSCGEELTAKRVQRWP